MEAIKQYIFGVPQYTLLIFVSYLLLIGVDINNKFKFWGFIFLLLGLAFWIIIPFGPGGADVQIYLYNASLYLKGVDVFGEERLKYVLSDKFFTKASYLDYSPLQFYVFEKTEYLTQKFDSSIEYLGLKVLHLISKVSLILALLFYHRNQLDKWNIIAYKSIILMVSAPYYVYNYLIHYNEKTFFITAGVLIIALWQKKWLGMLFSAIMFAYNGSMAFVIPIYGIFSLKKWGLKYTILVSILSIAIASGLFLIYGTEGLIMLTNRTTRVKTFGPLNNSPFAYLPEGLYSITLLYVIQFSLSAFAGYLALYKKNIRMAVVLCVWAILFISPFTNINRVLIVASLVIFTSVESSRFYYLSQASILLLLTFVDTKLPMSVWVNILPFLTLFFDLSFTRYNLRVYVTNRFSSRPQIREI